MKVIAVLVMSVNGKITNGTNEIVNWNSPEDKAYIRRIKKEAQVIIYGSKTYEIGKKTLKQSQRIIVHTRDPQSKSPVENVLFTDFSPKDVIALVEKEGHEQAIILGGGSIYALYAKEQMIDEFWITIEPKMFSQGTGVMDSKDYFENSLKLISCENLNKDTLLVKYSAL